VFLELLSKGNGFVPGGLPSACRYLGREGFVAVSGLTGRDARRQELHRGNDTVRSGYSNFTSDCRSGVEPRTC
jgi:hypothetical protein